jgi:thiamine-phosphate pyrophosphorylase
MAAPSPFRNALYLITDRRQLTGGATLPETVEQALAGGVRLIQLREKDLPAAELWPLAQQLRSLTRRFSAKLFINDRIDLALACGADGVHLGGHSLPTAEVRRLIGPRRLIGVSTHCLDDVARAAGQGADFLTFGPVYPTPSKAAYGPPQGLDLLKQASQRTALPVLALGGIKTPHVQAVMSHGASGIALISAVLSDADPRAAARRFSELLSQQR